MPYRVVEQLRTQDPSVILNSLEDAYNYLVLYGVTKEQAIADLDYRSDPFWVENREDIISTQNNIILDWDQENQILTRTLEFRDEQLFRDFREMLNKLYNPPRIVEIALAEVI